MSGLWRSDQRVVSAQQSPACIASTRFAAFVWIPVMWFHVGCSSLLGMETNFESGQIPVVWWNDTRIKEHFLVVSPVAYGVWLTMRASLTVSVPMNRRISYFVQLCYLKFVVTYQCIWLQINPEGKIVKNDYCPFRIEKLSDLHHILQLVAFS